VRPLALEAGLPALDDISTWIALVAPAGTPHTIRAKLAKSKIGKDGFTVRVQGGIAYWEGKTDVVQHKGSATRMAKTAGAKSVVNNIKVSDAGKEKAAGNLDDGRRRAQVKRSDPRTDK